MRLIARMLFMAGNCSSLSYLLSIVIKVKAGAGTDWRGRDDISRHVKCMMISLPSSGSVLATGGTVLAEFFEGDYVRILVALRHLDYT